MLTIQDKVFLVLAETLYLVLIRKPHFTFLSKAFTLIMECFYLSGYSGHIAMTYTALASLAILGDDLSRVDVGHITAGRKSI